MRFLAAAASVLPLWELFVTTRPSSATAVPDFSSPALRPSERKAIVEYVLNTPGLQETEYLEWKSGYDLSTRPGRASTAKQLIGFANRDISVAVRHAGGYAYLLLGVEPGNLAGMPSHDAADIENWLSPFVEAELRYDVHPVDIGGTRVLFFVVDPPQQGDPIFSLQRASAEPDGQALPEGAIYVRRPGKTESHDAADLKRLTARSQPVGTELELRVDASDEKLRAIDEALLSETARDKYLGRRREALIASLPKPDPMLGYSLVGLAGGESRSVDEFTRDVERFVQMATERWPTFVAYEALVSNPSAVVFAIVNDTDENYEDVVLELRLPVSRAMLHRSAGAARQTLKPPREPAPWGSSYEALLSDINPDVPGGDAVVLEKVGDLLTFVRFPPIHVRPRTRHDMPELLFALPPAYAGQEVPVGWRLTARNTKGDLPGIVPVQVAEGVDEEGGPNAASAAPAQHGSAGDDEGRR